MESATKDGKAITGKEEIASMATCPICKAVHEPNVMFCINKAAEDKDRNFWLELYKVNVEAEQYFLTEHHTRINFFAGILTTLIGATIVGIVQIPSQYLLLTLLGAVMIVVISYLGNKAVARLYGRFLESITVRAKLEHRLGLGKKSHGAGSSNEWWAVEQIVASRHLADREKFTTSEEFVENRLQVPSSYHGLASCMFWCVLYIGIALAIVILVLNYTLNS